MATAILLATPLHAADISWSGGEGDFNDEANWTGGVLPGGEDTAIVANGGTVWLTDPRTVGAIQVPDGSFGITPEQALTTAGGALTIGQQAGSVGRFDIDNGVFIANGAMSIGSAGGVGIFTFYNGFINRAGAGAVVVGEGEDSEGEFVQSSGFFNCMTSWTIGSGAGATGLLDFNGSSAANAHDWFIVGDNGASGTFNLHGGSFNKLDTMPGTHIAIGRGDGSVATVEQTGGLFINTNRDTYLGESGNATATFTISGSQSIAVFSSLILGYSDTATGSLVINGGTITAHGILKGESSGATSIVFNGGTLTPRSNGPDFISGIDTLTVDPGGLIVDTTPQINSGYDEHEIGFAGDLLDGGGGMTKRGVGSLTYEGTGFYTGATVVEGGTLFIDGSLTVSDATAAEGGTLAGSGTIGGSVMVEGTLAPGHGIGTLTVAEDVVVAGTLAVELTASEGDMLAVTGDLNVEGATLRIELPDGAPLMQPYVIATYGTRSGSGFSSIENGAGYTIDYAYEGNKIAVTPGLSPYENWAANFEWESEGDELAEADPDGDGFANALEFFLDGDPLIPGNPAGKPKGLVSEDRFLFTFERNAGAASVEPVIEYGTGLDLSSVAHDGEDGVVITTEPSPGGETWTVSFPMPPGGRLFARLKVDL